MSSARFILLVGMAVSGTSIVCADLSADSLKLPTLWSQPAERAAPRTGTPSTQTPGYDGIQAQGASAFAHNLVSLELPGSGMARGKIVPPPLWSGLDGAVIHNLPGLPTSAELFLSGLLGLGAWQAVRKPPHLNFSPVPAWCHADALAQIRHGDPFDLRSAPLAECAFLDSAGGRSTFFQLRHDLPTSCKSHLFLSVQAARAPPTSSLSDLVMSFMSVVGRQPATETREKGNENEVWIYFLDHDGPGCRLHDGLGRHRVH